MLPTTPDRRDELDIVAADHRVIARDSRAAILDAIETAAAENDGLVSANTIRPLLPEWARGPQFGATVCHLVRSGRLEWTGDFVLSGDARNRHQHTPVKQYRLVDDLGTEGAA